MKEKFKFLENISTADAAFEAYGKNLNEVFSNAARALTSIMIDPTSLKARIQKNIILHEKTTEKLLFAFLEELIFLKDAEQFLPKTCAVKILNNKLTATCTGETINYKRHKLGVDAKAVTYHKFELKQEKKGWKARVVVDI